MWMTRLGWRCPGRVISATGHSHHSLAAALASSQCPSRPLHSYSTLSCFPRHTKWSWKTTESCGLLGPERPLLPGRPHFPCSLCSVYYVLLCTMRRRNPLSRLREGTHVGVKGQKSTFTGGEINAAGHSGKDRALTARQWRQRGKAAFSLRGPQARHSVWM